MSPTAEQLISQQLDRIEGAINDPEFGLGALNRGMKELLGNGQPGHIQRLDRRIDEIIDKGARAQEQATSHRRWLTGAVIVALLGAILSAGIMLWDNRDEIHLHPTQVEGQK